MRAGTVLALLITSTLASQPLRAQDPPPVPPPVTPPVGSTVPDTVVVDSTQLRIRQRLQLLNRAPGSDSVRAQAYADSVESGQQRANSRFATDEDPDPDDVYGFLRALPGYTVTEYAGVAAEYSTTDQVLVLYGDSVVDASVTMADGRLTAKESIRFDEVTQEMDARGEPIYLPAEGDEIRADGLRWRANDDVGSARQARMTYSEGAAWNITSDFPEITPTRAYGHEAMFTSCDHDEPHYHFRTNQLKIVRGQILVAKDVRLYFGNVPVAWLPFIAQGLGRGRSSGLLTPRFSINDIVRTSGGYQRRVSNLGYYWAMSEYSDASVALDWFDNNYTAITGSARYRWARKFMQGSLSFRQFWRAEGGTELTLNTSHQWQMSERTSFNMRAAYASSSRFVTQNSFNPTEVTQSIDSEGGLQRRFDWGNLAVSGNRRQFLSDDRVEQTFPSLNLSLSTITLFPAPQGRAGPFNNITLSGGGSLRRSTTIRGEGDTQPDAGTLNGSLRSALTFGRVSVGGGLQYRENSAFGVRVDDRGLTRTDSISAIADLPSEISSQGAQIFDNPVFRQTLLQDYVDIVDIADARMSWNASIDYQQNLMGSTTFTPRVSWDSELLRSDTLGLDGFVSGPTRVSFGANLRSDIYGFFPGVGPWERIRHKLSPSFSYSYSPEVTPTQLQREVFGSSVINPRNVLNIGLNQTFEGRKRSPEAEEGDSTGLGGLAAPQQTEDGFTIPERAETELLLGIQTSALAYDFVADSTGRLVDGFTTASLNNTIRSDYLRGLAISMRHDLFDDGEIGADGVRSDKRFAPHLEGMNFNYSFSSRSSLFQWLGLGGGGGGGDEVTDPFARPGDADQGSVAAAEESLVPTSSRPQRISTGGGATAVGSWNVSLGYSLIRPRSSSPGQASQNVTISTQLVPTPNWDMSWRTSYDLENGGFNDHTIRLTRDLHRWEANFDFLQTATGNWSFRFEVRLTDNQDLKFDYQQRSLDRGDSFTRDFGR